MLNKSDVAVCSLRLHAAAGTDLNTVVKVGERPDEDDPAVDTGAAMRRMLTKVSTRADQRTITPNPSTIEHMLNNAHLYLTAAARA